MKNTVSIILAVWGEDYKQFIPRWWQSVKQLKRKPDEIVLVTNLLDSCQLLETIPSWVDTPLKKVKTNKDFLHEWWTAGLQESSKDYLVVIGVDDHFAPTALDAIDETNASLIIDRCQFLSGEIWEATWNPEANQNRRFAPAGISPFHRSLLTIWEKIPADMHWNDYLWYLLLAKDNISVYITNNLRMIHDTGRTHKTMSGHNLDIKTRKKADAQLKAVRARLGI